MIRIEFSTRCSSSTNSRRGRSARGVVAARRSPFRPPPRAGAARPRLRTRGSVPARAPLAPAGRLIGSTTVNAEPLPTSDSTSSSPWWLRMISSTIDRPRPVPVPTSLVVKNGSRILLRFSSGMPQPVSSMRIATWFGSYSARRDRDRALGLDRLGGVRDDVQEHLVDLRRRALDLRAAGRSTSRPWLCASRCSSRSPASCRDRAFTSKLAIGARSRRLKSFRLCAISVRSFKTRDAVAREVLDLLDRGLELLFAQQRLDVLQRVDEPRLIRGTVSEVLGLDRERRRGAS